MTDVLERAAVALRKAKVGDQIDCRVLQELMDEVVTLRKQCSDVLRRPRREEQA